VTGEDAATPLVLFALPRCFDIEASISQGALKPEFQTAHSAEQ
jgi:hypothetical protein